MKKIDISDPIVTIHQGKVRGYVSDDARGGKIFNFLGIPYAKPPLGDLRFKAPLPADPWEGVFDATNPGNMCIQENFLTKEMDGSEDCLNLNVYTSQLPIPNSRVPRGLLKPVMVFIHGGSFLSGSNSKAMHGPELLISENVVIVSINYRLGILGFMACDDPKLDIPGNAAFKDMVLALKWVQKNIHNFMGDSKNVTIFGNSAGAASVHFLILSPMAKGLFHKALCQSGSGLSSWAYAHNITKPIADALRVGSVNETELCKYLKDAPIQEIFNCQKKIDEETIKGNRFRFIGAVVEPARWRGEKFFSEHPVKLLMSGRYNKVPLMMGYNSGDGMIVDGMVDPKRNYIYWTDKEYNVPGLLNLKKGSSLSKQLGDDIVSFYFGNGSITRDTHLQEFYDITTDNSFLRGIYSSIQNHRRTSNMPIYMYRLSLESDVCFYKKIINVDLPGVCHADELGYLFTTILTEIPEPGSLEDLTQRRMCRMWANFSKFGNPTPTIDPLLDVIWPPVMDPDNVAFLDICDDLNVDFNPEKERMRFWDKIYARGELFAKL